jgi:putative membrane protein
MRRARWSGSLVAGFVNRERVVVMMWGYGWGWGYWLCMGVAMVLFWGLVIAAIAAIAAIVAIVRYAGSSRDTSRLTPASGQAHPDQVLAERFARGEIDEDEYKRRGELLRGSQ